MLRINKGLQRVGTSPYILCVVVMWCTGCEGPQSTLQPAGKGAERIANLWWWMLACASAIWLLMVALAIYAVRTSIDGSKSARLRMLIVGGGTVFPTMVLATLLLFSLPMLPELLAPAPENALKVEVRGKMWWWRVRYPSDEQEPIELANEIRIPIGQPVEFQLESDDVIHAFWVPRLGGKIDMIPGRTTRLTLEATETGVFRGACAEFCGASHAMMNFDVIVMEREQFERWLERQRAPAARPTDSLAVRGEQLFFHTGCHACHRVRGTQARARTGPDLTHVGSRHSIAAGVLRNEPDQYAAWISHPRKIKPSVKMPAFDMLSDGDLQAIGAYLESLQ